jgi:hypothetical protein
VLANFFHFHFAVANDARQRSNGLSVGFDRHAPSSAKADTVFVQEAFCFEALEFWIFERPARSTCGTNAVGKPKLPHVPLQTSELVNRTMQPPENAAKTPRDRAITLL